MGERKGEQEAYKGRFERMQKIVGRHRVQVTLSEDPQTLLFGDLCPAALYVSKIKIKDLKISIICPL